MTPNQPYNIALDCIDKHAASLLNKNKTALIFVDEAVLAGKKEPTRLSYSALKGLTNRMANLLQGQGLEKGERLLIRLPNGPEFPITFLGAIKAGLLPIPSSIEFKWQEWKYLLEDSGASALVTLPELLTEEFAQERPKTLKKVLVLSEPGEPLPPNTLRWQDLLKAASTDFLPQPTQGTDPAYLLYTSGTTGHPKAAIHSHLSIPAHDERARLWQNVTAGDVIFNTSALNWSYALTAGLLDMWRHGLTSLVYWGKLHPENIIQIIRRFGVTTFMSVPGIYRRLTSYIKDHPESFTGVRVCLSAGESLSPEIRQNFQKLTGLHLYEGLGMTENSVYIVQPFGEKPVIGSPGKILPSSGAKILHEDLTETKVGEVGILASHRSFPGLMLGYWGMKNSEKCFQRDWFLSGDLASRDETGNIFFMGRRDDVITSGGYRISPLEVEAVLNQHLQVKESAVTPWQTEPGKTLIQAFVVLTEETSSTAELEATLKQFAQQHLANYKVPHRIQFLSKLPKTTTGKIKRASLKEK